MKGYYMIRRSILVILINIFVALRLVATQIPEISVPITYHYSRGSNHLTANVDIYDVMHKGPQSGAIKVPITKLLIDGLEQSNPGLVELALRKGALCYFESQVLEKALISFINRATLHKNSVSTKQQQTTVGSIFCPAILTAIPLWNDGYYKCASLVMSAGMALAALY